VATLTACTTMAGNSNN